MRLGLVIALAACGTPTTPTTTPTPQPQTDPVEIDLTLRVRGEHQGRKFGVAPGDTLKTGDFVEMYIDLSAPAYLYVVQFFPDGTSAVLFPDHGDRLVPAGTEIRLPDTAQSFQLDEHRGEENVYLIASREPVARADAAIAADIDEIRVSGSDGSEPPPTPPTADAGVAPVRQPAVAVDAGVAPRPQQHAKAKARADHMLTLATRNLKLVKHAGDPALSASTHVRHDLLVVRFTFGHE